LWLSGYSD